LMNLPSGECYEYALATGERAASRLSLVQSVYGPDAERLMSLVGIQAGQRIVDFGCGTGASLPWFAKEVGPGGQVVGLDSSIDQIEVARQFCQDLGLLNVGFVEANVYNTGLAPDHFDVAHCRLLLCHLQKPEEGVWEMARTVRPGGVVICSDIDLNGLTSIPHTQSYTRMRELYLERRRLDGLDNELVPKLAQMMHRAGLVEPEMAVFQPVFFRGDNKRLWELTFSESSARTLAKGLISESELGELLRQLAEVAASGEIAVAQAPMSVCWARKPSG
jgi:ubiquinone/menaquinone biosynthesis C-methylase UbiE